MTEQFSVFGIDKVKDNLKKFNIDFVSGVKKAVMDCGQDLKRKSQEQVPIDTHNLERSCVVEMTGEASVEVSYNTEYALKQHESLEYRHTQGKAKYLEDPLTQNKQKYIEYIKTGGKSGL